MSRKRFFPILVLLLTTVIISACTASATQTAETSTDVPIVEDFAVVAEGRLVPNESVQLSFQAGGQVSEILFAEGDAVQAGDVLARLGDREQVETGFANAQLELSAAQFELLSAQQDLQTLHDNWPAAATAAQEALTNAREEARDAERTLNYRTSPADQTDIDVAWSQVVLAEDKLEKARDDFEPYEDKPADNLTRAAFQSVLAEAQGAYDDAVRHYNSLVNTSNDFEISQAQASAAIAQARLEQSQEDYDELIEGPDPDQVALAEARITAAEARVAAAQSNVVAAQSALDNLELTATFDGSLVAIDIIVGEQVAPGQPVVTLADFSQWYIETDNLTEIEVVEVLVGQAVTIIPDALPDVELTGKVDSIADVFEEKRGDVTYTARIQVDEIDPLLRWGMTVVVTFVE